MQKCQVLYSSFKRWHAVFFSSQILFHLSPVLLPVFYLMVEAAVEPFVNHLEEAVDLLSAAVLCKSQDSLHGSLFCAKRLCLKSFIFTPSAHVAKGTFVPGKQVKLLLSFLRRTTTPLEDVKLGASMTASVVCPRMARRLAHVPASLGQPLPSPSDFDTL